MLLPLFAITQVWPQFSLPPLPPPPPLPPAPPSASGATTAAQNTRPSTSVAPTKVNLNAYIKALRSYAKGELTTDQPQKGDRSAYVQLARTELAASPYVRDLSIGIFQELDRYTSANRAAAQNAGPKKPPGMSLSQLASHPDRIVKPLADQRKAAEKADTDAALRQDAAEKSIATRLASLEQQISTPIGQQFVLPENCALYRALTQPADFSKELEDNLGKIPSDG